MVCVGDSPALGRGARVEDVEAVALLVQGDVRVAEDHRVGVGEAPPQPGEAPIGRPGVVQHDDGRAGGVDLRARAGAACAAPARPRCPGPRARAARGRAAAPSTSSCTRSPACRMASAAARRSRHASGIRRRAPGQVGVRDDRQLHAALSCQIRGQVARADVAAQRHAPVAQWIERAPPEREVAGSNPAGRVGPNAVTDLASRVCDARRAGSCGAWPPHTSLRGDPGADARVIASIGVAPCRDASRC